MSKITCHAKGNLFIKCKNCGYSWNTPVVMHQEVDDTCPNCNVDKQLQIVCTAPDGIHAKSYSGVEIPEFMDKPIEIVTMQSHEYHKVIREHYNGGRRAGISLGFKSGLIWGLLIGTVVFGIVLSILLVPLNILP